MAKTIKYKKVNKLSNEDFKRVTGISKETFKEMLQVVTKYYRKTKSKGGRKKALTPSDEILVARERIIIEQINAKIKVFKITKYPYRNRRKRFGLRMNIICAIINLDAKSIDTKVEEDK